MNVFDLALELVRRLWRRLRSTKLPVWALLVVLVFPAIIGGCGSSSSALSPSNAEALAQRALPDASDLSGGGQWSLERSDSFHVPAFVGEPACGNASYAEDQVQSLINKGVIGRSERAFNRVVRIAADRLSLDFAIYVFRDGEDVSKVVGQRRKYIEESGYVDCLKQSLRVDLALSSASTPPSENAYVLSYEILGRAPAQFESYGWRSGNMLVTLSVTSLPPSSVARAIVDESLRCLEIKVESALREENQDCPK